MSKGLTDELVAEWLAASPWPRARWLLIGATFVAVFVSVFSIGAPFCGAVGPVACAPRPVESALLALALAPVVLVWSRPTAAAGSAIAFGIYALGDSLVAAQVAWPAVAVLYAAYAVHVRRCQARQGAIVGRAREWVPPQGRPSRNKVGQEGWRIGSVALAIGALVLVNGAYVSWHLYQRAVDSDAEHESRSVIVTATVLTEADDEGEDEFEQRVLLDEPPPGFPAEIDLEFFGYPDKGDRVDLRIDPTAPEWTHPLREPPDRTWWLAIVLGSLILATTLLERLASGVWRRNRLERLASGSEVTGVRVRVRLSKEGRAALVAVDSSRVLAGMSVDPDDGFDAGGLVEAHLVGDVHRGGWVAVRTPTALLSPVGPLQRPDAQQIGDDGRDELDAEGIATVHPVPEGAVPSRLPVQGVHPGWRRWAGLAVALTLGSGCAWVYLTMDDFERPLAMLGVCVAIYAGIRQFADRYVVTVDEVRTRSVMLQTIVPMGVIREVFVDDRSVKLVIDDDTAVTFPAIGEDPHAVAAAVEQAQRAVSSAAENVMRRQPAPTALLFLVLCAAVAGSWLHRIL